MQRLGSGRRLYATATNPFPFPTSKSPRPHEIFHLPRNATAEDVKARYYELVRVYHPDRARAADGIEPEIAHARFQAISAAYSALQRGTSRSSYVASDDNPHSTGSPTTDAAAWRAMHIYRRRKLYEGGDDRWKDRLIIAGVGGGLALFVAQMFWTREQALQEVASMPRTRPLSSSSRSTTPVLSSRPEDNRLSEDA